MYFCEASQGEADRPFIAIHSDRFGQPEPDFGFDQGVAW